MDHNFNQQMQEPFRIGSVSLANRLVQAPMASISGRAYRLQARRFGVGLTVTEMISSYGVHFQNRRTAEMLELVPGEHPVAVQLFGNDSQVMAEAAVVAEAAGADIIDINMGCPVRKVMKTGAGAALMADEELAVAIVAAMVAAVRTPVMAKMRSGLTSEVTALSLAQRLAGAGAAAICIHPRSAAQAWRGEPDHAVTDALAQSLEIPVIASGDVAGLEDVRRLLRGGAAAVMLGRGPLGNPWLYGDLLAGEQPCSRPLDQVLDELLKFAKDAEAEMGPERAGRYLRKFYGWYLSRFKTSGELRHALLQTTSAEEAIALAQKELGAQP